jgi:hypothetical protein
MREKKLPMVEDAMSGPRGTNPHRHRAKEAPMWRSWRTCLRPRISERNYRVNIA